MLGTISVAAMLPTKIEISLGPDLAATLQGSGSSGLAPDCFVKLVTNLVFAALADTPRRGEEDMSIGGEVASMGSSGPDRSFSTDIDNSARVIGVDSRP
jgi:hypothetical protein